MSWQGAASIARGGIGDCMFTGTADVFEPSDVHADTIDPDAQLKLSSDAQATVPNARDRGYSFDLIAVKRYQVD
jgi:hypothetical protein